MKKLHLRNIIKEVLKEEVGYSKYAPGGTTPGLSKNVLDKILLRIAKGEDLEGDSEERGNKVLDKADPENVARIIRGELPQYSEEVDRMQELAGIQSEIKVNNPNKPNLSIPLLMDINKLFGSDIWTEGEKNIIEDIMGDYIDDNLVQTISSEINGDEVFDDYPRYLEEPSFQDNFKGFINNWSRLPRSIINKLS